MRRTFAGLALGLTVSLALGLAAAPARSDEPGAALPAGTELHFHLTGAVSSDRNTRGDPFSFVMLEPVRVDGREIVAAGAIGTGTILVAGHAGSQGHEGDLTFELDRVPAVGGGTIAFDRQRFEINGRNRKVQSNVLQFVPYVGLAALFIRGSNERIDPSQPIETTLLHPARISSVPVVTASPAPAPSGIPSPAATTR